MNTFFIADQHFYHSNILNFLKEDGQHLRTGFSTINDMNDYIIKSHNSVVKKNDKVYFIGDVIMKKSAWMYEIIQEMNGEKILIRGNHDNAKLNIYAKYFKDVRATHGMKTSNHRRLCLSHIPIHVDSLGNAFNIHGHLHHKEINDYRYINVGCELLNYIPISIQGISEIIEKRILENGTT
jgi:calcineurin-like phosphoesterase family protein